MRRKQPITIGQNFFNNSCPIAEFLHGKQQQHTIKYQSKMQLSGLETAEDKSVVHPLYRQGTTVRLLIQNDTRYRYEN